ncbi:MAG: phenylalanine--tRNA ligase beta subunit-related protein [Myxococcota bacterium]|nr:phenylalanine--tRNA ligase beta subunit-related protein [Myxococcota bacterium]
MGRMLSADLDLPDVLLGVVRAEGVVNGPSPAGLAAELAAEAARVGAEEGYPAPELKKAVRDVLRTRGYKPAGRGKPASEYLAGMARKGDFPVISTLVDVNNLVSLESGLPISVLDLGKFVAAPVLRFGGDDESYVFNASGQEIGLRGLIVVCDGDTPRGTPIKDSMATKVNEETDRVLAVIYGTRAALTEQQMERHARRFADLLEAHAGATGIDVEVL